MKSAQINNKNINIEDINIKYDCLQVLCWISFTTKVFLLRSDMINTSFWLAGGC